ncbi:MAG: hypothetical protein GC182_13825 [Rhodopseudomonas sp.]|nr:hypothetical protein [Rhodopseudomonas sp.]
MLHANPTLVALPNGSKIAERLLAHAHLFRAMASASWNEETAQRLVRKAEECTRAAAEAEFESLSGRGEP